MRISGQEGFTLVELLAATLVLIIGMLSVFSVLDTSMSKTTTNRQRVGATNLAREITEAARSATYAQLTTAHAAAELQDGNSSLQSSSAGGIWTVERANATYTITTTACTFDDPADGIATLPPDHKCSNNPAGPSGDANGDDFRRLTVRVNWVDRDNRPVTFQQTTLINNPAGGIGPRIISFLQHPTIAPITGGTLATFKVTSSFAAAIHWNADDGVSEGDAVRTNATYSNWDVTWDLKPVGSAGAVLDGTYVVNAQALDDRGIAGDTKLTEVVINRSTPFAPTGFQGGHNTRAGDWVDLEWNYNNERDISGYQVFWAGPDDQVGTSDDQQVCPASGDRLPPDVNACSHLTPPNGATRYYVWALDAQDVGARTVLDVTAPGAQPAAPGGLAVSGVDAPTLTWSAPTSGSVAFYRIYRDGTAIGDRVGKTNDLSFTDGGVQGGSHTYSVTAVDGKYNESAVLGPVGWVG